MIKRTYSRKNVWKTFLIFYLIFLFYMILIKKENEFIFLFTTPEDIWFPILNVLYIGFLYIYYFKSMVTKGKVLPRETEGIIVFIVIVTSMVLFSFNYLKYQPEYYKIKDGKLQTFIIAGLTNHPHPDFPLGNRRVITFYKKDGFLTYRSTRSSVLGKWSVSGKLKNLDYIFDKDTNKIIIDGTDYYFE
ncbi:hypothetical protein V1503_19115 [Bacillus sp. SCS-151]|uniref:hypothetical protein n=1 Tax=Nanhaiella sioensis TaxID=3115293 RepID=UPI00397A3D64